LQIFFIKSCKSELFEPFVLFNIEVKMWGFIRWFNKSHLKWCIQFAHFCIEYRNGCVDARCDHLKKDVVEWMSSSPRSCKDINNKKTNDATISINACKDINNEMMLDVKGGICTLIHP
jgi:hypothetical protein